MKCPECGNDCQPIIVQVRPESSEWHCTNAACNKSYEMSPEDYANLTGTGVRRRPQ